MSDLNFVIVEGNLVKDPELKETESGLPFCKFSVANNFSFRKGGEWINDVNFFSVTAWSRTAETCIKYLKKGYPVRIKGRLDQNRYEDKTGKKISFIDITAQTIDFLPRKKAKEEVAA